MFVRISMMTVLRTLVLPALLAAGTVVAAPAANAKSVVIDTIPIKGGRVSVNGDFVGVAPVEVDLKFGLFFRPSRSKIATAEKDGTNANWSTRFDRTSNEVIVRLEEDRYYASTQSSNVANKWLTVSPKQNSASSDLWQKIVSVVTDNFTDLESLNDGSRYLRTAWRMRRFPNSVARNRLVIKRDVSHQNAFKVMLESQVARKSSRTQVADTDFETTSRVFRSDKETIDFLRDQL